MRAVLLVCASLIASTFFAADCHAQEELHHWIEIYNQACSDAEEAQEYVDALTNQLDLINLNIESTQSQYDLDVDALNDLDACLLLLDPDMGESVTQIPGIDFDPVATGFDSDLRYYGLLGTDEESTDMSPEVLEELRTDTKSLADTYEVYVMNGDADLSMYRSEAFDVLNLLTEWQANLAAAEALKIEAQNRIAELQ